MLYFSRRAVPHAWPALPGCRLGQLLAPEKIFLGANNFFCGPVKFFCGAEKGFSAPKIGPAGPGFPADVLLPVLNHKGGTFFCKQITIFRSLKHPGEM